MADNVVGKAVIKESVSGFRALYESTVSHKDQANTPSDQWKLEAPLRYRHLQEKDRGVVDALLRGWCPLEELPIIPSRIVKVFISSTFTDMSNERNRLMVSIYPKLKAYCRERHGVEFQLIDMRWGVPSPHDLEEEAKKNEEGVVVDMRWGVPADAWKSHATTELCLEEIRKCVKDSLGPHFIAFLGQRNGSRTLPAVIQMPVYESIRKALRDMDVDVTLLDQWYLKDSNYQPPVYILQPIDLILGSDHSPWKNIYEELDAQLLKGAEACVDAGVLEQIVLDRLKASVTALEVMEAFGSLPTDEEKNRNCLSFMRTIIDIESKLDREYAAMYADQYADKQGVNKASSKAMNQLKNMVKSGLHRDNIYEGSIQWIDPYGVDPVGHDAYLEQLCVNFYSKTRKLIDQNFQQKEKTIKDDLYDDVLHHWVMCREKCSKFMGRGDVLSQIKDYILSITEEPLILYGESGHGKTSIMAKAASSVQQWLLEDGRNMQTTTVVRFCGTSPTSSAIRTLLPSICHQTAYTTDRFRHLIPNSYKHIKKYFLDFLSQGEFRGLVVIILDALDQLSPNDGAHKLDWLPAKLSKNVKIIVSTLPEHILKQLNGKVTDPERYINVLPLEQKACEEILSSWMKNAGKMLQFRQWQVVREAFAKCSLPLFIQLTYRQVINWHSYEEAETLSLTYCVNDSINSLFDHLEAKYGKTLVCHALAYLTASGGLSAAEMDDILSLDDIVLNSVFTFWEPPIRRTPPNLWQRIKNDISGYLVEREDSEMEILYWYHRQFIEVARDRYLKDHDLCKYIHSTLAEYFLGTWSRTKKKPFLYEPFLMERLGRTEREGEAIRYVPEQPLIYTTFSTSTRYNLRKLNHLPTQLAKAGRVDELKQEVYFNYEWISVKLQATSVQNVIADYNLIENDKEIDLVGDAIRMCESALTMDHNALGVELSGRLLPHAPKFQSIQRLIKQCDIAAVYKVGVVPNWQIYSCPGGPLQYFCEAEASIKSSLDVSTIEGQDRVLLAAKPFHSTRMRVWDITQGEPKLDIQLPPGSSIYPTMDGQFVTLFNKNKSLQIFRVESGQMYGDVPFQKAEVQQIAVSNKYAAFTFKQAVGPCVVDLEARSMIHRFQYQSDSVTISCDDHYLLCSAGQLIAFHEFPLMERKNLIKAPDLPLKLAFHKQDSKRFFAMFKNNEIRAYKMDFVHKTNKNEVLLHDIDLKDFKVSHTDKLLLARALRCLFVVDIGDPEQYKFKYRIDKMPSGVFQEKLSTFKEAGFTPDDQLLIAARHTYLGVWSADTGEPLRLLQSTVSPIVNMFTSSIANKVITVLRDNTIPVWNLDNLYEDVDHCNFIVKGSVQSLDISKSGTKIVACGSQYCEARVLDLSTGETERNIVHSEEVGKLIRQVQVSPQGRYCVTRCDNLDVEDYQKPWDLIYEDKLWNTVTGDLVFQTTRSHTVIFSQEDEKVVFFRCRNYSLYDFTVNAYEAVCFNTIIGQTVRIELPEGELVGEPVIIDSGRYLAALIQSFNEDKSCKVNLCVYSFEGQWYGVKSLELLNLWSGVEHTDSFLHMKVMNRDKLLVIYKNNTNPIPYYPNGELDFSGPVTKSALVFSVRQNLLIRRMDTILAEDSDVSKLHASCNLSVVMDDKFRFFNIILNERMHQLKLPGDISTKSVTLLLDGRYIAVISGNKREILIFRCKDGTQKSRFFVHGFATNISVAGDDRTLVVGCSDGRVMILTVLFDHPDPVGELVGSLNSRKLRQRNTADLNVLKTDIKSIDITRAQLEQLSVTKEYLHKEKQKKPASFKAVATGVIMVQQNQKRSTSRACVIQ